MKAVVIKGEEAVLEDVALPPIGEGEMLVKVLAAAGNPTDWKHIAYKLGPQGSIIGCDAAGEVVKLGPNVEGYNVGDLVCGSVHGGSVKHPENGGFAEYSVFDNKLSMKIPQNSKLSGKDRIPAGPVTTLEGAASLPMALYTAGLVLTCNLGVKTEWQPSKPQHDFPLLIWGAGTSIGQCIIQLAKKMNGYTKIIVVASRKHENLLKDYGADELYDYHDSDVVEQIKAKYEYLPHLIDSVSVPESFTQVYELGSKHGPTTLVRLTVVNESLIIPEKRNSNVKVEGPMLYLLHGLEVPFGNMTFPANPQYRADGIKFIKFIEPKINSAEIHHMPIQTYDGLESVPGLIKDIKQGKNAGVKYVAVLK